MNDRLFAQAKRLTEHGSTDPDEVREFARAVVWEIEWKEKVIKALDDALQASIARAVATRPAFTEE